MFTKSTRDETKNTFTKNDVLHREKLIEGYLCGQTRIPIAIEHLNSLYHLHCSGWREVNQKAMRVFITEGEVANTNLLSSLQL